MPQRLLARARFDQVEAQGLEDGLESQQVVGPVVDEEHPGNPRAVQRIVPDHRSSHSRMRDRSWLISTGFVM